MNDEINEKKSFIYVEFANVGSADPTTWQFENISPMQLLAMSQFLEFEGKSTLAVQREAQIRAQLEREQMQKIAVPKPNIEIGKK